MKQYSDNDRRTIPSRLEGCNGQQGSAGQPSLGTFQAVEEKNSVFAISKLLNTRQWRCVVVIVRRTYHSNRAFLYHVKSHNCYSQHWPSKQIPLQSGTAKDIIYFHPCKILYSVCVGMYHPSTRNLHPSMPHATTIRHTYRKSVVHSLLEPQGTIFFKNTIILDLSILRIIALHPLTRLSTLRWPFPASHGAFTLKRLKQWFIWSVFRQWPLPDRGPSLTIGSRTYILSNESRVTFRCVDIALRHVCVGRQPISLYFVCIDLMDCLQIGVWFLMSSLLIFHLLEALWVAVDQVILNKLLNQSMGRPLRGYQARCGAMQERYWLAGQC